MTKLCPVLQQSSTTGLNVWRAAVLGLHWQVPLQSLTLHAQEYNLGPPQPQDKSHPDSIIQTPDDNNSYKPARSCNPEHCKPNGAVAVTSACRRARSRSPASVPTPRALQGRQPGCHKHMHGRPLSKLLAPDPGSASRTAPGAVTSARTPACTLEAQHRICVLLIASSCATPFKDPDEYS